MDTAHDLALGSQHRLELRALHHERHRVLMESGHGKLSRVAGAEPNGRVRRRLSNPEVRGMDDLLTEREGHGEHRDRLTRGEFELLGLSLRRHLCLYGAIEKED